ncbi:Peptidoglycan/LPS O-acetylase OafA/YrhL, contains acyltransferase and SGNH-hydrolase domains [Pseudobutyrivibrio sp. UC1225]|uniref:acyltransferase family protein n=1 Tax=Pseudobutyrivibrio sp. UC1225 TaxID=1798185 RepID=UPI0008DFD355|nr:acyltransferase [Pseudobutyrivibrio sp. UC1225]SFO27315.1 Peptidoglycan/LPS O-acetylase OafA/YrhL, contains acyltransferase and SGNH-hydrolase domains [Pseudobutyrivibrio sp. UC1225]
MKQSKNNAIQGLRFWAITLIILSHCGFLAQGGLGNNIFFAMSGFFVCQPFTQDNFEFNYFTPKAFGHYYLKRFMRIIPACWLCMFFGTWGLNFFDFRNFQTDNSLLLNMFFIKSKNHLWFLQQEVFFYLVAPFIILIIAAFKKLLGKLGLAALQMNLAVFAFLNLLVFVSYQLLPKAPALFLNGNGYASPLRLWLFLIGMSFAYMLKLVKLLAPKVSAAGVRTLEIVGSVYVVICLMLSIVSSVDILTLIDKRLSDCYVGWEHPVLITYMAALAIMILCLLSEVNIVRRFMGNRVFTLVGNVSFSMYLLHFMLMLHFSDLSAYRIFVVVYLLSLAMSIAIYNYVEQPLINKTKEYLN